MRRIGIRLHGITLDLRSDSEALLGYVAGALRDVVCTLDRKPDLEVTVRWDDRGSTATDEPSGNGGAPGRFVTPCWRDPDLQLGFHRGGGTHRFDIRYRYQPSAKKLLNHPDLADRKRFEILRYAVQFPVAWLLGRSRSWTLIHGAFVVHRGRGVLLVGPGGAGKTTTAMAVAARAGMTVLGENLLLWDGAEVRGLAEPARPELSGVALADPAAAGLERIDLPGGSGRLLYRLSPHATNAAARPAAVILLRTGRTSRGLTPMRSLEAHERLLAVHRMATEIKDYDAYTATLDLHWPEPGHSEALRSRLALLHFTTPAYSLDVDRTAGIDATVEHVLEALGTQQEASWIPR